MLKFNPDFAEAVRPMSLNISKFYLHQNAEKEYFLPHLFVGFSLFLALPKLLEQHEGPGHLPLCPQSLTLF